ncbi:MAG: acetyl-CoA carboxylase biotin carboxyl carrier protein subunit, partial [Rhodothermales bacterium]
MKYSVEHAGRAVDVDLSGADAGTGDAVGAQPVRTVEVDGRHIQIQWTAAGNRRLLRIGHRLHRIDDIRVSDGVVRFALNGTWVETRVKDERDMLLERLGFTRSSGVRDGQLNAPMPGRIHQILIAEGDHVELDQPVVILEAMKMENELKSPVK